MSQERRIPAKAPIKVYIKHVLQVHGSKIDWLKEYMLEASAYSQFLIAKLLLRSPNTLIFVEGLTENLNYDVEIVQKAELRRSCEEFRKFFPCGIPHDFNSFSKEQKEVLSQYSCSSILYNFGQIKKLYKTNSVKKETEIQASIKRFEDAGLEGEAEKLRLNERDQYALHCIKKIAFADGKKETNVLLIMGAGHDIEGAIKIFNASSIASPNCELIYDGAVNTVSKSYWQALDKLREAYMRSALTKNLHFYYRAIPFTLILGLFIDHSYRGPLLLIFFLGIVLLVDLTLAFKHQTNVNIKFYATEQRIRTIPEDLDNNHVHMGTAVI